jgi:predicted metal-binding protein
VTDKAGTTRKIKELERFALENGADRVKAFSARSVALDERVRMKCQIPLCPHYDRTLTCPPNIPTVEEFRTVLRRYKAALIVQIVNPLSREPESYDREEIKEFFQNPGKKSKKKGGEKDTRTDDLVSVKDAAVRLHKLINAVELRAISSGFPYALGLIGGECMLCTECVGVGSLKSCRRPYEARPSMEGVGIDVIKTSQKAGLPFEIPPKKEIVWSGLVLID